jgi:hypothetical protein
MTQPTPQEILNLPLQRNDALAATVREYLTALLKQVWEEAEAFSGKRPFGNSGWQDELYQPLVKAELVAGSLDTDGWLEDVDTQTADRLILSAIDALGAVDG